MKFQRMRLRGKRGQSWQRWFSYRVAGKRLDAAIANNTRRARNTSLGYQNAFISNPNAFTAYDEGESK